MHISTHGYQYATNRELKLLLAALPNRLQPIAEHGETTEPNGTTQQKFSKEGFVDAIVEWIVADDQVCL